MFYNNKKAKNWINVLNLFLTVHFHDCLKIFWPKNGHNSVIVKDNLTIPTAMSSKEARLKSTVKDYFQRYF
jgi:hypothetical protein